MEKGTEQITTVFKSCYKLYVPHFHLALEEAINTWWDEWKKCNCNLLMKLPFLSTIDRRLSCSERVSRRRCATLGLPGLPSGSKSCSTVSVKKGYPSDWIPDDIFKQLKEYWASDEYMALKRTNKANRSSSAGGSLHTGGSITYTATTEKMLEELGRTPTQSEVLTRTHTKKKDRSQWVDRRAEEANQQYEEELKRLEEERAALIDADYDEIWARVTGGRKRGRVYGRGKVPSRLKPTVYDSDDLSTASGQLTCESRSDAYRALLYPDGRVRSVEEHRVSNVQLHVEHASWLSLLQRRNATSDASSTAASTTVSARTFRCDRPAAVVCR
ncbi:hypothetical protein PIB30_040213 [Stylosanthes scabra]|uniref:Uncharacterized protein n=1 Tax=Stylosanthes scabra TaxID=79078 RepID=A0ABU6RF88_9FABA|nr:hypothetical protein [Stylosanthes scabra]